jgi:hypothetical protein
MRGKREIVCMPKMLPQRLLVKAAATAVKINPVNAPVLGPLAALGPGFSEVMEPLHLAVLTSKYWGPTPRRLTVSFMESTPPDLRARIISHMNAWAKATCIQFVETQGTGQIRIFRGPGGYWSYLGTDILLIPQNRPTMNLEGFTMKTPESEYKRVVRHQTGHTLGFPHEHMGRELIQRIDPAKAYEHFRRTQGWDPRTVDQQVLTPLDQQSIMGTAADQTSIMCYELPETITRNGLPIRGGTDISQMDYAFASRLYPKPGREQMPEPRYLNTLFIEPDNQTAIAADRPLSYGQPYTLYVNISPERKGLGEDDLPFPEQALDECWGDQEVLSLTVIAASRDFDIEPRMRPLNLPRDGPAEGVRFAVSPKRLEGRGFIQVEVFYRGYLLQSKQVEALIVPGAGAGVIASFRPVQTARTTFTTTARLDPDALALLPERVLTVDVERDPQDGSVDFRFLDRSQGDKLLAYYDTHLQPQALGQAIDAVRKLLTLMATGEPDGYRWKLRGDDALLNAWLPRLADSGRSLYRALLPENRGHVPDEDQGERLRLALQPGTVIQVNPVLGVVTIPWALLYERQVKYVEGRTRVCDRFATGKVDCAGCPSTDDPYIVCPSAFWGYRYAVEQLPCWVNSEMPHPAALVREIGNGQPLLLNFNVWRDFPLWRAHLLKIAPAGQVKILTAEEIHDLEAVWENHSANLDVVYFYCHGGLDDVERRPYLELSDGRITSNFLDASELSWPHNPLVFLNGCATGDYGPQSYVSLIDDFRKAGACGVVGTECPMPELFAEAFAAALFPRLFRRELLGQAMLEVRLEFLRNHKNPLGLAYTLYAAHEIALARPVIGA